MDTRLTNALGQKKCGKRSNDDNYSPQCTTCRGLGMIFRPIITIMTPGQITYVEDNFIRVDDTYVSQKMGGIDACPDCGRHAEAEFVL